MQEARTGVISLPESAQIVEDLLREMYDLSIPSLCDKWKAGDCISKVVYLCDLHIAADKV